MATVTQNRGGEPDYGRWPGVGRLIAIKERGSALNNMLELPENEYTSLRLPSQVLAPDASPHPAVPGPSKWIVLLRRSFSYPVLLGALLVSTVYGLGQQGMSDPDIWLHLLNAEYLVNTHALPRAEMYSFTAGGLPWMNPEYLAEVPYFVAWHAFGLAGIKVLSLLLLEGIFLGLLYICWKESGNIKASAIACYFAAFLGTVTFGPRTILFGYAYLVVLLVVLQRFRLRGRAPLWLIPPLFCLWINTHGSWSLGLTVFGIVIAGGLIGGQWGKIEAVRWTPTQLRQLLLTMGASIAGLFINPYGYRLVLYPLDLAFRQNLAVNNVAEWVTVDFHSFRGKLVLMLIVALILGALLSEDRWGLHEIGLVLFGLYSGLTYSRFLVLAAILIAPLLAKFLRFLPPYHPEADKPIVNAVLIAGMLVFIGHGFPSSAKLQKAIDKDYPTDVLPYLKSHELTGRVLNSYSWGGYLCWNDRKFKEFIDSRADIFVYGGVFKDYIEFMGLFRADEVLDKYGIQYVLLPRKDVVTLLLNRSPGWKPVFTGDVTVLFKRVGDPPPAEFRNAAMVGDMRAW